MSSTMAPAIPLFPKNAHDYVREAVNTLDPHRTGFKVPKVVQYALAHMRAEQGPIPFAAEDASEAGLAQKARTYNPRIRNIRNGAGDLRNDEFFTFTAAIVGLDDTPNATRKSIYMLTHPEYRQVIALRTKQQRSSKAKLAELVELEDTYPHWANDPTKTLGEIIGVFFDFE